MDAQFHRYLLNELRWELDQHNVAPPELKEVLPEQAEVLSHSGCASLRIRVPSAIFDIGLSWRKDTPPTIEKVTESARS